ncbi:glycosyltransferase family 4 protein [Echinimonas agarilytica]|uniref:Glycosyltransferase family 4 protein n=1 Tax=Echinimonas agarilytica TaxID=1215918 RepID=A0AA41W6M0_9GAMM|nr:glycosyltransferase family 4 protein [Echinimonas agarilytica]MCM2679529.1 glycosyltransferase family 4 protein [Echinimonas agarilytica]
MCGKAIWLMLDSRSNGGIESHVCELATALHQRGHQVSVVFWKRYHKAHPLEVTLQEREINCVVLKGSIHSYMKALQTHQPDIVHTHGYKAGIAARLCAKFYHYAVVSSFHAGEPGQGKVRIYDWLDRASASFSDHRIAVSQGVAERLPAATEVIQNFVTLPNDIERTQDYLGEVAFVGRLSHEKAPDRFIALAMVHPELKFVVYGDGPMADQLRQSAPSNVYFKGMVEDMSRHWKHIGLLCMPSRFEGLPLAALEALSHGIPVLAAPVGGLKSLICDDVNGWLVDGTDQERWHSHIDHWTSISAGQRSAMSLRSRLLIAKHYSPDAILPKFESIYGQVAG